MSTTMSPHTPLQLARLETPETIGDVVRNIDQVIDWSIKAESHLGYFAVLYKRTTLAIRDAVNAGVFDDGPRMEQLDLVLFFLQLIIRLQRPYLLLFLQAVHAVIPNTVRDPTASD